MHDVSYDPAYIRETCPQWSGVSEEAFGSALPNDPSFAGPKTPHERLSAMGLELADYPAAFPWQLYARIVPMAGAHRWAALEHFCIHGFASGIELPFEADGKPFLVALARGYAARDDKLAIRAFERAAVVAPLTSSERQHLADSYLREKLWQPARQIYESLVHDGQHGEATAWTVRNCVLASLALNDWDHAVQTLTTSRAAMGDDPIWRSSTADLLEQCFEAGLRSARARYAACDAAGGDAVVAATVAGTCDLIQRLETPRPLTHGSREVIVIANCDDPRSRRYRVDPKDVLFTSIGTPWRLIPMGELEADRSLPSSANAVIFFNVPATLEPLRVLLAAQAAGIGTIFEADGPVFDPSCMPPPLASYDGFLAPSVHDELRLACALYRALAARCDVGIAAASLTAAKLATLVKCAASFVLANGVDTDRAAAVRGTRVTRCLFLRSERFLSVTVEPGSLGAALVAALRSDPSLRLVVSGYVRLTDAFNDHDAQIDELGADASKAEIEAALGSAVLNIAPAAVRDDDGFADTSWLEAARCGIATAIDRRVADALGLEDGRTCVTVDEGDWARALARSLAEPEALTAIGQLAHERARTTRGITARADQLASALAELAALRRPIADQAFDRA